MTGENGSPDAAARDSGARAIHPRHVRSAAVRLLISAVAGAPAGLIAAIWLNPIEAALLGWCVFCAVNLTLSWQCVRRAGPHSTQASVERYDQSQAWMLAIICACVLVSLAAIGLMLSTSRNLPRTERAAHVIFAIATVALSWLHVHVRFAFHYAHLYYRHPSAAHRPLTFPGGAPPGYLDFLYFAFVLGMTSQTADVAINSRAVRSLALLHGLIAFGFNLAILALSINIVASTIV